jgi:DNA-binding winged helix-turn-helix (wHTH) protein
MRFVFSDCALDPDALELRRGGEAVPLSTRGLRLLVLLLERRPRPVPQRELRDALWPQTHVGYTSLAQVVAEVRKAIGDQPGVEEIIRTVPRVGYSFVAAVREEPPREAGPPGGDALDVEPGGPSPPGPFAVAAAPPAPAEDRPRSRAAEPGESGRGDGRSRWRPGRRLLLFAGLLLAAAAGAWLGARQSSAPPPRFTQLTFRRGVVTSARFSHDGHTVVYSALWDGGPPEIFARRLDSPASVSLALPPSTLLSLSSRSELAVLVAPPGERGVLWLGTLATVPLTGGPLRPVREGVLDADWSPDGRELAAIRWKDGQFQLEYPLGRVLLRPCSATKLRVSPGGDRVALLDPEGILVVDRTGSARRLAIPAAHQRLAWRSDESLLVDASASDLRRTLRRVSPDGTVEEICALAGTLVVHDVSRDGRVLLHHGFERWDVRARAPGEDTEHGASVHANSQVQGLSADGERILLWDGGEGPPGSALLYPTRGGPPVRLGAGQPVGLSADAAWFVLDARAEEAGGALVLGPTGAGPTCRIPLGGLSFPGPFFVGEGSVGFNAAEPGRPRRSFLADLDGSKPRAVTPEGRVAVPGLLPTGEVLARADDGTLSVHPLSGQGGRPLPWRLPADPFLETVGTTDDGRFLVVREGSMPARLDRVELATGRRTAWRTLGPPDATGVGHVWTILVTPDGRGYAYTHGFFLQDLFLVEGLL